MTNKILNISPSPHVHSGDSVEKNMYGVLLAMLPAYLVALYYFGLGALIVSLTAVVACVFFEWAIQRFIIKGPTTIGDGSAILTGLLLAFNLPSNLPIWIIVIGALVAIGVGKMSFGGLGNNPFNPAIVGRVFLLISFPAQMTTWAMPSGDWSNFLDAQTGATLLTLVKDGDLALGQDRLTWIKLGLGDVGGSMGEVGAIALLLGFAYMLIRKIITWHIPVSILVTAFIFAAALHLVNPQEYVSPVFHLLSGGLLLGAIFMATDYVTSPMSKKGMLIYGVGIGIITMVIRVFGAYPEGISFAILLMNACTPLLNRYIKPKRFGEKLSK